MVKDCDKRGDNMKFRLIIKLDEVELIAIDEKIERLIEKENTLRDALYIFEHQLLIISKIDVIDYK